MPYKDYAENLRTLQQMGEDEGYDLVWVNMPVNRLEAEFVGRYVDWTYRSRTFELAETLDLPVIDVDGRWVRTREAGLHIEGHVFHPNARGHRRLAEQVAAELLDRQLLPGVDGEVAPGGPEPAAGEDVLRFGWSSLTPVHAHVGAVLEEHPEIAARHGLEVEDRRLPAAAGHRARPWPGALDAFFSCEVPAIRMLSSRPDARIVASPGVLGRIAVVAPAGTTLAGLAGKRVGVAPGSTPDLDWQRWGRGLRAETVPLQTDALQAALTEGQVDAIVGWDPWVEQWLRDSGGAWEVVTARPFHSVLAVGTLWALADETRQPGRRRRSARPPRARAHRGRPAGRRRRSGALRRRGRRGVGVAGRGGPGGRGSERPAVGIPTPPWT